MHYERERPGKLLHVDVKKLGPIVRVGHRLTGDRSKRAKGQAGRTYLSAAIDDRTRLGFARPTRTTRPTRCSPSQRLASASTGSTGSGSSACSSTTAPASSAAGERGASGSGSPSARRGPTDRSPNGKAERIIRTLLELWAYAYPYARERERAAALAPALDSYNPFRRHRARRADAPSARQQPLWDEHLGSPSESERVSALAGAHIARMSCRRFTGAGRAR